MSGPRRSGRGWMVAGAGLLVALGLAGYGIRSRSSKVQAMQQTADQAAIPTVQVISAKSGPAQLSLTLPGDVAGWNEAPIYAQVSGYVKHWYKDYGAHGPCCTDQLGWGLGPGSVEDVLLCESGTWRSLVRVAPP